MPSTRSIVHFLLATGDSAPDLDAKMNMLKGIRDSAGDQNEEIDRYLVSENIRLRDCLAKAGNNQKELKALLDKMVQPPWFPARYLRRVTTDQGPRVLVLQGRSERVVTPADDVDLDAFQVGDEVFLNSELNVIVSGAEDGGRRCGETAPFEETISDGRIALSWRDEKVVVDVAGSLNPDTLERGDLVRWDREAWLAFEKIERTEGREYFLEDVGCLDSSHVGGQSESLDHLIASLSAAILHPELATRYGVSVRRCFLMFGPPGNGKTLMARVASSVVSGLLGRRCRFAVVRPAEFYSPYVGVTEQNIRACFAALRKAAEDGVAILFLDEVEAIGRIRGNMSGYHSDRFLNVLLTEIDGFEDLTNVAIIAATNRKDLVDPALLARLGQGEIRVDPPNMRGAREIFDIHLPPGLAYAETEGNPDGIRQSMIDASVSRFYSPNAENAICTIRFRDNSTRSVSARELVSGRLFKQVCDAARDRAFLREVQGGPQGITPCDMEEALDSAMERLRSTLTVDNVHAYLTDIPEDHRVVRVDPVEATVKSTARFLRVV